MIKINKIHSGKADTAHHERALAALMKFRLIINLAKRHFKWVEQQCGINGAQLWVLRELHQKPGLRVTELAAAMAMHQSTISNLIDRLAKAALITRVRSSHDERVVTLSLTDAGKQLLRRAPKPARGVLAEALYQLPEMELASLDKLLAKVLEHMPSNDTQSMKKPLAELLLNK